MALDRETALKDLLVYANRALIEIDAIEIRHSEPDASASAVLRYCHQIYTNLLQFKQLMDLAPNQAHTLQTVIDRLKVHLQRLGEDV